MNDQRSTTDQLRDAVHILNREGLYDAADHCRREVERVDTRLRMNHVANLTVPSIEAQWAHRMTATDEELDALFDRHRKGSAE